MSEITPGFSEATTSDRKPPQGDRRPAEWSAQRIPAHLTEEAVGTPPPDGETFSVADWRANRLADALAQTVSNANAAQPTVDKLVNSAEVATTHACALLGVVTYAANHKQVPAEHPDGTNMLRFCETLLTTDRGGKRR